MKNELNDKNETKIGILPNVYKRNVPCWVHHRKTENHTDAIGVYNTLGESEVKFLIQAYQITLMWNCNINEMKRNTMYHLVGHLHHFVLWSRMHLRPPSALETHAIVTGWGAQ